MLRFCFSGHRYHRGWATKVFSAVLGVLTCTASVLAGGGRVLPPDAAPKGYSLSDMAVETAVYNTGEADGLTEPLPKVPFEVLVPEIADYTVKSGAMLYVPVYYADDSGPPSVPPFPKNISDQDEDADYLADLAYDDFGATDFFVQVDSDEPTILCDDYVVGVKTAALPDGTPAGHHYIVAAAFLSALTPGEHTVGIGGIIDGEPVVFVSYTVTVKP